MDVQIVPIWISSSMRPIQRRSAATHSARRSGRAIEASGLQRRVAVAASGAFSFEVGGPRMSEESHVGVPAPDWAVRVSETARLRRRRADRRRDDAGAARHRGQRLR